MSPQERSQIHNFILQARESGTPDTEIMSFLANKGVLSAVNPEKYGTSSLAVETATPTIGGRQLNQGFAPVDPMAMNQQEPQRQGFFSRVGGRLSERGSRIAEQFSTEAAETANPIRRGVRVAGDVIGAGLDVVGEGLTTAARGIGTTANIATAPARGVASLFGAPDAVTAKPTEQLKTLANKIAESPLGEAAFQALGSGVEQWEQFSAENPEVARDLQALGNIVSVLPVGTAAQAAGRQAQRLGIRSDELGARIGASATANLSREAREAATEIVQPEMTFRVRRDEALRLNEGGILQQRSLNPTRFEENMADALARVPGFDHNQTMRHNAQSAHQHIGTLARELDSELARTQIAFPRQEHMAYIRNNMQPFLDRPVLRGNPRGAAEEMIEEYGKILAQHPSTAVGAMQARREFDQWFKGWAPKGLEADRTANVVNQTAQELRMLSNDFIAGKTPSVPVKELLQEQALLFNAIDNMRPKVAREAGSTLDRISDNISRVVSMRGRFSQTAGTVVGLGGLGAAATFAPVYTGVAGAGLATYGGYRLVTDNRTYKALGDTLQSINRVLPETGGAERTLLMQTRQELQDLLEVVSVSTAITQTRQNQNDEVGE